MTTIDPRAVEAAANQYALLLLGKPLDKLNAETRAAVIEEAGAILDVAAPFLRSQALNDEAALWQKYHDEGHPEAYPYGWDEVAAGLRARATAHEKDAR